MILAIDFDGVIHDFKHPLVGRRMGTPIAGCKESLDTLKRLGHKIIVHTVWGDDKGRPAIEKFMKYYELSYDEITNIKPNADVYLDDKAMFFYSWRKALDDIQERENGNKN